jgi:hypothetical protein
MRVEPDRFAQYARRADASVRASAPSSGRPDASVCAVLDAGEVGAPEVKVTIEFLDESPTALRRSGVLPAARSLEDAMLGGASLDAVPVIAVSKEDRGWFAFEADANALLAMIDGRTTVREIIASVALSPERAIAVLQELETQRVIAVS